MILLRKLHSPRFSGRSCIRIELEFGNVGFWGEGKTGGPGERHLGAENRTNNKLNPHMTPRERGEGKTGVPGEKPLGAEKRTNNKLNPHMTSSLGIEPRPHWWKASAFTTAPTPLPYSIHLLNSIIYVYSL